MEIVRIQYGTQDLHNSLFRFGRFVQTVVNERSISIQSARVCYHICLHLSTVGLLSVSRLTDQSARSSNCR